jgi:hypothetical protein
MALSHVGPAWAIREEISAGLTTITVSAVTGVGVKDVDPGRALLTRAARVVGEGEWMGAGLIMAWETWNFFWSGQLSERAPCPTPLIPFAQHRKHEIGHEQIVSILHEGAGQ